MTMENTSRVASAPISSALTVIIPDKPRRTTVLVPLFFSRLHLSSIPASVLDRVKWVRKTITRSMASHKRSYTPS